MESLAASHSSFFCLFVCLLNGFLLDAETGPQSSCEKTSVQDSGRFAPQRCGRVVYSGGFGLDCFVFPVSRRVDSSLHQQLPPDVCLPACVLHTFVTNNIVLRPNGPSFPGSSLADAQEGGVIPRVPVCSCVFPRVPACSRVFLCVPV